MNQNLKQNYIFGRVIKNFKVQNGYLIVQRNNIDTH